MAVSRRGFIKQGMLVILTAGVPLSARQLIYGQQAGTPSSESGQGYEIPFESRLDPLNYISQATFEANLRTIFRVRTEGSQPLGLTLIEVSTIGPVPDQTVPGRECFVLSFSGPLDRALAQNTYHVEHDALGAFDLFIVPGKKDKKRSYYYAIINRLNP